MTRTERHRVRSLRAVAFVALAGFCGPLGAGFSVLSASPADVVAFFELTLHVAADIAFVAAGVEAFSLGRFAARAAGFGFSGSFGHRWILRLDLKSTMGQKSKGRAERALWVVHDYLRGAENNYNRGMGDKTQRRRRPLWLDVLFGIGLITSVIIGIVLFMDFGPAAAIAFVGLIFALIRIAAMALRPPDMWH